MTHTFINVGPSGTLRKTGAHSTSIADLDEIVKTVKERPDRHLLLHFHGGLVDEAAGVGVAMRMATAYGAAPYAVSFVWETGWWEVLSSNLSRVSQTELFQKLLFLVMKRASAKLGIDLAGRGGSQGLTDAEIRLVLEGRATTANFDDAARSSAVLLVPQAVALDPKALDQSVQPLVAAELLGEMRTAVAMDEDAFVRALEAAAAATDKTDDLTLPSALIATAPSASTNTGARGVALTTLIAFGVKVAWGVIRRYILGRDHGLHATVVEEILRQVYLADVGSWVWGSMKASANAMWNNTSGVGDPSDAAGGFYLFNELSKLDPKPTIDVVGHSAGSIVVCQLVAALARETAWGLRLRNVAFLAPACSYELFAQTILPNVALLSAFRMFTMSDEAERRDVLADKLPMLYPSSLLYLVSGAFEGDVDVPLLGMQRFLTGKAPFAGGSFDAVKQFLDQSGRVVFSKTPPDASDGLRCTAIDHGSFDEDAETLRSLTHFSRLAT